MDWTPPNKLKPLFHKSLVTGKEYPYDEYTNHGWGGVKRGFKDLPAAEYPYTIIYESPENYRPLWL